jgi:hypothetical protein
VLEISARRVAIAALQLVAVGEGKRVHDEIERAPFLADHLEHAFDAFQILDIGLLDDRGANRLGERHGATAEGPALVAEGKLGALAMQHASDAPGDGAVVGDAHHQPPLFGHQRSGLGDICCCCHGTCSGYGWMEIAAFIG